MSSTSTEVGRFFKHSGIYAIGNALNRVGAFLLLPIYTRLLTPAEYGTLETLYLVSSVVSGVLGVGIAHATLRFYFDYKDAADRRAVVSTNLIASIAISTAGVLVVALFSTPLAGWLFKGQGISNLGGAMHWMLATIVFELASQVGLAYVRAVERSMLFIVVSFVKLVVQVIANSVALMHFDAGVEGVMAGNCLTVGLGFAVLSWVTLRECGLRFEWAKLMPVLRYSLPLLWTTMVGIVASTADRFLLQSLVSLEALGIYALALKLSKLASDLVGEPINRAYGAFRFTIMERDDAGTIQAQVVRYLAVILSLIGLAIVLFAGDALRLIAAPAYWSAARYLPWLVLAAVLQVLTYPLQTGIYYQKQSSSIFHIAIAACIAGLVLGVPLIWAFGILGACLSVLGVSIVSVVMTDRISQRFFPVHYEWRKLGTLLALVVAVAVAGQLADQLPLLWSLPLRFVLGAAFLVGIVATRVIEPAELAAARAKLLQRLGRPSGAAA
ncbi:oligosaccharide flippase family protein [Rhizobacter sp. SG703]|uniref:lipopolysaccharide biosynthesis protein n=1 Tax=Rhizobacter sp. SG703 TaxID=2587140 RepID=UPI001446768B|nr:oligosaccharide flippase family protein [Rhizobacter sp. SG703]NKI92872.1 O-antigen/teichoic acid export membrane protein [Rhizobacter sp. SG703]